MDKFALDSIKIKSSWFEGKKKSMFQKMGKEEGLNLYLQLFKFRVHQGDINQHYFITSINELRKFTKTNYKRKLSNKKIAEMLQVFEKLGIIKNHAFKDWSTLYDDNGKVIADKLLKFEATDVPNMYVDEKGNQINKTEDDLYLHVSFDLVNYIYDVKGLSSRHLSVFYLIRKLSNSSAEKKAWININTIKEWLGFSNDTVTSILIDLNKAGLIATVVRRRKKSVKFEHFAWFSSSNYPVEDHYNKHKDIINKFLRRYNEQIEDENIDENPFSNIEGDWGVSPY